MPDASVNLCEGERAVAAQRLFPDYAYMSWFGDVAQVKHARLENGVVIVWPNADATGFGARRHFMDDFEACIAHLRFPVTHRRAIRTLFVGNAPASRSSRMHLRARRPEADVRCAHPCRRALSHRCRQKKSRSGI